MRGWDPSCLSPGLWPGLLKREAEWKGQNEEGPPLLKGKVPCLPHPTHTGKEGPLPPSQSAGCRPACHGEVILAPLFAILGCVCQPPPQVAPEPWAGTWVEKVWGSAGVPSALAAVACLSGHPWGLSCRGWALCLFIGGWVEGGAAWSLRHPDLTIFQDTSRSRLR